MLTPHAIDIAVIISSLIASQRFTFVDVFKISSSNLLMHWPAELQTNPYDQGSTDWLTDRVSEFACPLNSYFEFCKIVVKMELIL